MTATGLDPHGRRPAPIPGLRWGTLALGGLAMAGTVAVLVIIGPVLTRERGPRPIEWSSATGIESRGCAASVISTLDRLNRGPNLQAHLVSATCRPATVLRKVRARGGDGRHLKWTTNQGPDDLAWMLSTGRERR